MKKVVGWVFVGSTTTVNWTLKYDFESTGKTIAVTATGGTAAEFNISEFSDSGSGIGYKNPSATILEESEFTGGIALRTLQVPGAGAGQVLKLGCNLNTTAAAFALQQINLFAKIGRIAT